MSDVVDQEARDLAREAIADIREHASVCTEIEKRRDLRFDEMRGWMERSQKSYEAGMLQLSAQIGSAVDSIRREVQDQKKALDKHKIDNQGVHKDLFNRFWLLLWTYAGAITFAAVYLFALNLHWLK